ncbi:TetR/AcrR family transcriptional regulator [uncultured Hoeflea sp.]|uniref:TetR/AcrR family transcriptional regulator n=1 Tax=uncultured Hoeflea sp. TaxID=538666 RepID=UPI0026127FAD|nr:TetR/AcrR family transcriptional regulator [uncultured Hoeflea sp.]
MSGKQRMTRERWIATAFELLLLEGPKVIRVDRLCTELTLTKGSFYWHFKDLAALKSAMVSHWRQVTRSELISSATADGQSPRDLVLKLFEAASLRQPGDHAATMASIAIRHWAGADPAVRRDLADADNERLAFLTTQIRAAGWSGAEARSRASFLNAALIGLEQLAGEPAQTPTNLSGVIDAMLAPKAGSQA